MITDARLEYIKLRVRIRDRSAGDWKSLCQPSSGWLPFLFWATGKNEAAKREKMAPYCICLFKIYWASNHPTAPPPPPYSHVTCPGGSVIHGSAAYNYSILLYIFFNNWNRLNGAQNSLHLAIMGRTERTWVGRIYANEIGAYLQRLRLDYAGVQAEWAFADRTCPTRPVFSWQFMIWCYTGRVKRNDSFTSDECGLTNRAFNIPGCPTFHSGVLRLYSHLFI